MPGMQFPYPRKSSTASAFAPRTTSRSYGGRRRNPRSLAPYLVGGVALIWFLVWLFAGSTSSRASRPPGTPEVVIVTTLDPKLSESYKTNIKENREYYAHKHGYATFYPNTTDYDLMPNVPQSWATVPALRHAMTKYPHTPWLWYLTSTALIMNTKDSVYDRVLDPAKLGPMMITDAPVVPPDSVIKTFSHLKPERVDLILSPDREGLAGGSLLVRSGDWAKFFLDAWYDPLYRSYNFQKAEGHALEHMVQWHGTVLAKLALIPQRIINSYTSSNSGEAGQYQEGDFIANFHGCARDSSRNCEQEMAPLMVRWRELKDHAMRR
ncbi:glycosyltransferase family 34 protein [Teratosphaeria destructans]|uniref:Glycosyltransferase family 34 protein n=1 Tax=Teratosphaeria destructans TaxID=418781 RepID=A0A9W7SJ99_9PEZI|nr:glycosyltransferase family 34 protein [Teratosphaeria destructans]